MPSYEYSAWVIVKTNDRDAADLLLEDAQDEIAKIFGERVALHIDDGEPNIEEEDDEVD